MTVRVEPGNMLDVIPRLVAEGVQCDACVTDAPYHLTSGNIATDFAAYRGPYRGPPTNRAARKGGFMGQVWDGGDIAFRPETWATVATILRPGAFLLAFGGTRTHHRLVCAIEDAGFVVQDQIAWVFGSGFPKRRDRLKPAFEPICLTYKPGGKRTLQVDECRISTDGETISAGHADSIRRGNFHEHEGWDRPWKHDAALHAGRRDAAIERANALGRWPANLIHDGSDEVLAEFPNSDAGQPQNERGKGGFWGASNGVPCGPQYGDDGSAARFFYSAKADAQIRWGSRHPTVKPVELIRYLVKLACPPGGLFIDPFAGSGTAGVAALAEGRDAILIEREPDYITDITERMAHYSGDGQHSLTAKARHAPQKPLEGLFAK